MCDCYGGKVMFIVKKNLEMVNKTFRLPKELVERLEAVASDQQVSMNNLVRQCCEYALDNIEPIKS